MQRRVQLGEVAVQSARRDDQERRDRAADGPERVRRGTSAPGRRRWARTEPVGRCGLQVWGYTSAMFFFFSNRVGCLGSLVISAIVTVILIIIFSR
jgi:hypothetical protein